MKRVPRNSYLGLVPPRVICEVGDGGGWPTSRITRGGASPFTYTVYVIIFNICAFLEILVVYVFFHKTGLGLEILAVYVYPAYMLS